MQEKLDRNIPVMRHFDDIDDLLNFDRDGNLIPGQEAKALLIAEELISEVKKEEKRAIMFVCSSKRRATQTAHLVADEIRKIDNKMKVRVVQQDGLSAID
ncbi:MAG: hypothetical protein HY226_06340, partial [Candidatus Vogelbacteria bacterium]|nr:hypothetical protein [Candidatus Vogelbacteria bacterium]